MSNILLPQMISKAKIIDLIKQYAPTPPANVVPAFHANKNGTNQSFVPTGVWTKITFTNEVFDTQNNFASSRFTPTTPGKYLIITAAQMLAGMTFNSAEIAIYKNGSKVIKDVPTEGMSNSRAHPHPTAIVEANGSTDYFEVYAYNGADFLDATISGQTDVTYFQGFKITEG